MNILEQEAHNILKEALDYYQPVKAYALFSGGHDSLTSTSLSMKSGLVDSVVHINTGIGIPDTRIFVRETCKRQEWPLLELHPPALQYKDIIRKYGFPGPGAHIYTYVWLKERALHRLGRDSRIKRGEPVAFITGVRKQESRNRMGYVGTVTKQGSYIWIAPIANWSKLDCNRYLEQECLQRNSVVDKLHMSGECLCGAYARQGELSEIKYWFPDVANYIDQLEKIALQNGHTRLWGGASAEGQQMDFLPMCMKCDQEAISSSSSFEVN